MSISHFQRITWIFLFLFIGGCIVFIPYPYAILPDIGAFFRPFTLAILQFLYDEKPLSLASDEKGMLLFGLTWAIISFLGGIILNFGKKTEKIYLFIRQYLPLGMAYYLSLQLFRYGFDKVFKHQFYLPEPNTLFTPLGYLDKDILYWSTIGSSYSFSVFGGLMEVVPAFLLLFRRTRLLGAIISLGVMTQVVMINFGFDITVKGLSSFMLLLSFLLIIPYLSSLYTFFIQGEKAQLTSVNPSYTQNKFYIYLKYSLVALIFIESLYPFIQSGYFNDDLAPRPPYHGAYQVLSFWKNGDTLSYQNPQRWKRFFVHRGGYFITQDNDEQMQDYECSTDSILHRIDFYKENEYFGALQIEKKNNLYSLSGSINKDSIKLIAKRLPLTKVK